MNHISVSFSPLLFSQQYFQEPFIAVVVDILRATTSMVTAFEYGVERIIPVLSEKELKAWKAKGYLVAGERGGLRPDYADYGNAPSEFKNPDLKGKTLVFSTTNGTKAIEAAKHKNSEIAIGAFGNLKSLCKWIRKQNKNIVILCSGYEGDFCIEDSLLAGALVTKITKNNDKISFYGDSANISMQMWEQARNDMGDYLEGSEHVERLKKINQMDDLEFAFTEDTCDIIPVYDYTCQCLRLAKVNK